MSDTDPLADRPFSYRELKGERVAIAYRGRTVVTLRGKQAAQFMRKVSGRDDGEQQLVMAKATGQFKMGNEKAHVSKY